MDGEAMDMRQVWEEVVKVAAQEVYTTIRILPGNNEWPQHNQHQRSIHLHRLIHRQIERGHAKRF